jgi:O-methyltransferase
MMDALREHSGNWKASPRKWQITYILSRLRGIAGASFRRHRLAKNREKLLSPTIEAEYVEILSDPEFRSSVAQVKDYTCLDIARLANLWNLARLAGPGIFLEVGSFRGGTALHICNAIGHRGASFYCFDPFEEGGFENLSDQDTCFKPSDFTDTRYEAVVKLLSSRPNAKVIQGYFPAAAESLNLHDIAFCHLDVDVYEATKNSLDYLAPRLAARSLIVLDDINHRETPGVNTAVAEFRAGHPSFLFIPVFPVQAVLLPKSLW